MERRGLDPLSVAEHVAEHELLTSDERLRAIPCHQSCQGEYQSCYECVVPHLSRSVLVERARYVVTVG